MKSVWPALTDFSVPHPRLYLPIHGPQWWFGHRGHTCDNSSCSQFHCLAYLLEWLQACGPEKTRQGWGRSIWFKEIWIYHSLILRGVRFSQDSFFSSQRAGGLWTDFNNNLSECESRNAASRDLKAASPSAVFHGKEGLVPRQSNKGVSLGKRSENQTVDSTIINNHLDETLHDFKSRFKNRLLPLRDIRYF